MGLLNLQIGQRIMVASSLSVVLCAAIGLTAITRMNVMAHASDQITSDGLPVNNTARDILLQVVNEETGVRGYVATGDERFLQPLTEGRETIQKDFSFLGERYADHPIMRELVEDEVKPQLTKIDRFFDELIDKVKSGDREGASKALGDGKTNMDAFRGIMAKVFKDTDKLVGDHRQASEQAHASAATGIFVLSGIGLVLTIAAAAWLSRSFKGAVGRLTAWMDQLGQDVLNLGDAMRELSDGNLTVRADAKLVRSEDKDEFAIVYNRAVEKVSTAVDGYETARSKMAGLIGRVSDNASAVAETSQALAAASQQSGAAAAEIASGGQRLAAESADAAAVVHELSSQIESVSSSTHDQQRLMETARGELDQTANLIEHVSTAATGVRSAAEEGATAVRLTVEAMARVRKQAEESTVRVQALDARGREIGDIVKSISGIADQTNLLALNAAIEAARAGEHGRGFAVVAEEVRKLAEQASNSTKEIGALVTTVRQAVDETVATIAKTAKEVEEGAARTETAGEALTNILSAAATVSTRADEVANKTRQVTKIMASVVRAAEENASSAQDMASGSTRVSQTISSVAAVSEESAASAEELTASIEEVGSAASNLAQMSDELKRLVSQFQLESRVVHAPQLRRAA